MCVSRDMEHLGSLESTKLKRLELLWAAPRATLMPLSCSPNFPRAQNYLDLRTRQTHELIVNLMLNVRQVFGLFDSKVHKICRFHFTYSSQLSGQTLPTINVFEAILNSWTFRILHIIFPFIFFIQSQSPPFLRKHYYKITHLIL